MKYQLDMTQKQRLSQNMIQSAEILQMSSQELNIYIRELAMENPLVDLEELDNQGNREQTDRKLEWLDQIDENNRVYSKQERNDEDKDNLWNFIGDSIEDDLSRYLLSQLPAYRLSDSEEKMIGFMIDSLDSRGYFTDSLKDTADYLKIREEEVIRLLKLIQTMEPAGIGGRNLRECLLLQIDRKQMDSPIVKTIVSEYLELLAKNQLPLIAKKMNVEVEEIILAIEKIKELNPKPGSSFASRDNLNYIIPDVTIVKLEGYFEILLNEYKYPQITISSYYKNILNEDCPKETRDYIDSKMRQAEWLKNCIAQRNATLLNITKSIVDIQNEFFFRGTGLKPLRLLDVAERLGVHESTVSRAVREKYLQCTWGVYPMNYFFSKALDKNGGDSISTDAIREKIAVLIQEEDKGKPLSDQKITELLNRDGITISRRTVAKYRNQMGIKDASGRRSFLQGG